MSKSPNDEFLMWIGLCITAWAKVEEYLFAVCEECLGTRTDRAAIVYYRTPTIDARIKLIDELVRTRLPTRERKSGGHDHPDLKEWDDLRKDTLALLSTRRRIAHHPVKARTEMEQAMIVTEAGEALVTEAGEALVALKEKTWLEIYSSEAERLRPGTGEVSPLKFDHLVQHCSSVQEIARRTAEFLRKTLPKHSG
jgi:hypothetical protein